MPDAYFIGQGQRNLLEINLPNAGLEGQGIVMLDLLSNPPAKCRFREQGVVMLDLLSHPAGKCGLGELSNVSLEMLNQF